MYESLLATLAGDGRLTPGQVDLIRMLFVPQSFAKGRFFHRGGEVARRGAFVVRGCFRTYAVDEAGREAVLYFSPEGRWIGDLQSATMGSPSPYLVEAIEPSQVLTIDVSSLERMLEAIPEVARSFRSALQRSHAAGQRRIALSLHSSAEDRYLAFLEKHPSLPGRIPQHMLASYLGITPETLSRIRARLRER